MNENLIARLKAIREEARNPRSDFNLDYQLGMLLTDLGDADARDHPRLAASERAAVGAAGGGAVPVAEVEGASVGRVRDFSKWAQLIVEQVHDIYQNGQSEGLSAADIVERTLDQVFPERKALVLGLASALHPGLWLVHIAPLGRVSFVQVPDDADDRRLPLDEAATRLLVPALAALRQERGES